MTATTSPQTNQQPQQQPSQKQQQQEQQHQCETHDDTIRYTALREEEASPPQRKREALQNRVEAAKARLLQAKEIVSEKAREKLSAAEIQLQQQMKKHRKEKTNTDAEVASNDNKGNEEKNSPQEQQQQLPLEVDDTMRQRMWRFAQTTSSMALERRMQMQDTWSDYYRQLTWQQIAWTNAQAHPYAALGCVVVALYFIRIPFVVAKDAVGMSRAAWKAACWMRSRFRGR